MKVFATRIITESGVQKMREAGIIINQWQEKQELSPDQLIQNCLNHDALIAAGPFKIDRSFLQQCQHLKIIAIHGVGYDHVDIEAATELKIPVATTPGAVDESTAETAFLLMLMVARKAIHNHKRIIADQWSFFEPTANLGIEVKGKTLGVFGLGNIGLQMARLCKAAYGMKIIYHNRGRSIEAEKEVGAVKVSFNELLQQSDVLSVHAALNAETRGIFNKDAFEKMKPSSIFINTARGGIHHEEDLTEALSNRSIWGAGLDVTNPEPMKADNPLLTMEYATILPHIGTSTEEAREKMVSMIAENIIAAFKNERIPYVVNGEIYKDV